MRRRPVIILLLIMMFGASTESHAFMEWLYKLSGPGPFIGAKVGIRFTCPEGKVKACRLVEWGIGPGVASDAQPKWTGKVGIGYAESLRNDLDYPEGIDSPKVYIWSIEPSLERWFHSADSEHSNFVSGTVVLSEFQGRQFTDFRRNAIALRVGRRWKIENSLLRALELGGKITIFEQQFRPSDFGALGNSTEPQEVFGFFATAYIGKTVNR